MAETPLEYRLRLLKEAMIRREIFLPNDESLLEELNAVKVTGRGRILPHTVSPRVNALALAVLASHMDSTGAPEREGSVAPEVRERFRLHSSTIDYPPTFRRDLSNPLYHGPRRRDRS